MADELKVAGALYEDCEVVVDGNLVTSRELSDLPAFMRETMKQLRPCCSQIMLMRLHMTIRANMTFVTEAIAPVLIW